MNLADDFELDDLPVANHQTVAANDAATESIIEGAGNIIAGVYQAMPNHEYHAQRDWLSRGGLAVLNHSPTRFRYMQMNCNSKSTRAMDAGSLFHDLILLGEDYVSMHYLHEPKVNKRTNDGKEEISAFHGLVAGNQTIICEEDWDLMRYMRDSVFKNDLAREVLEHQQTYFEHSHFAEKEVNGSMVKTRVRPDIKNSEFSIICDLKSIDPKVAWEDAVLSHGYDLQSIMYSDVIELSEGWKADQFWFIVTEKKKENPITEVRMLSDWHIRRGESLYHTGLNQYADLMKSGDWFMPRITQKPRWAKED